MSALIPFQFDGRDIRVVADDDGEPLFVGKDICDALKYADSTTAIRSHCRGVQKLHPIPDSRGRMQETRVISESDVLRLIVNCTLPAAQAFERLVFEEILPTIRKTGGYGLRKQAVSALAPAKEFRALFGIGRLIGLDKNAAAISANQGVAALTGTNMLELLGQVHLEAENQDAQFFTPTELGGRIGASARRLNQLLAEAGFQLRRGEVWEVMDAGREFAKIYDTGKRHGSGVPIQQIKWSAAVLNILKQGEEA